MSLAESDAMSERILGTLYKIITSDHEINEFAVIPTEINNMNRSPILFEQHNIGLESWCVKHVYQYACSGIFNYRIQLSKRKLPFLASEDLNRLLTGAILINPDMYTFWNMRREMVESDLLNIEKELYFNSIVLSYKSKSNEAFSYRRWLLKKIFHKFESNHLNVPLNLLENELSVIQSAAEKSPNNYHSWNHRIWCLENLAGKMDNLQTILCSELAFSQEWVETHVSEHSGFHYRQYLIKFISSSRKCLRVFEMYYDFVINKLLNTLNDGDYINLLNYLLGPSDTCRPLTETYCYINYISIMLYDLCVLVDKLNSLFPEHESIFYHRRFLVHHLLNLPCQYHTKRGGTNSVVSVISADDSNQWPKLFKVSSILENGSKICNLVMRHEKVFCSDSNNSKFQVERYMKWLQNIMGLKQMN